MPGLLGGASRTDDLKTTQGYLTTIKAGLYREIVASDPGPGRALPLRGAAPGIGFSASQVAQSLVAGATSGVILPGGVRAQARFVVDNLLRYTEASVKLAVIESIEILINTTPIDTSWAAHSWFPSIGGGRLDNGGYLIEPGEETSGTVVSFDDLAAEESGGRDYSNDFDDYDEFGTDDPAAAFLREHDPDFEGSGEIVSIEHEFKLQQRQDAQRGAINAFRRQRIFVNKNVVRSPSISNNVPYIGELNEGKSRQTPRNFVGRAIIAGLARLELRATAFGTTGRVGGRVPRII